MSTGIQESVRLGLLIMANNVEDGKYGEGDDAFKGDNDDELGHKFLSDLHDEVLDKME